MENFTVVPGKELYNHVRAAFIIKDKTINEWCRENNISLANAKSCLHGAWDGPKGRELRVRIIKESGAMVLLMKTNEGQHGSSKVA